MIAYLRRLTHHEPLWTEVWSGVTALGWALYAILLYDLDGALVYQTVLAVIPEPWLQGGAITLGLAQVACAAAGCRRCRWTVALAMTLFWGVLGWGLFLDGAGPASIVYGGWAAANMASMALLFRRQHP